MIHTNLWSPDTCGCELTFTWDDAVDATERVHTCAAVKSCTAHNALSSGVGLSRSADQGHTPGDNATTWSAVHEENQRKNMALGAAIALPALAGLVSTSVTTEGTPKTTWTKPPAFNFDENRVLHLSFGLTSTAVVATVQAAMDAAVGAGTTIVT